MKRTVRPAVVISAAVLVVICCGGRLYGIEPFGSAMFCALMDFATGGVLVVVSSATYVLCSYLFTFEVWRLYLAGAVFLLVAVRWFLGLKFRRFCSTPFKAAVSVSALVLEAGLSVLEGAEFGEEGRGFIRMNFAVTRAVLTEVLARLERLFG